MRIPGCPLFAPETWVRLLEEEGFGRILLPLAAARHLGQQIFVAESDGMVRRQFKPQGKTKPPAFIRKAPARIMTASSRAASRDDLEKNAEHYLKKLLSSALKLSMEQIDAGEPLENYGIDSILMLQLTGELEKAFGSLSKTLFFEYQDLRSLTDYFLKAHRERVEQLVASIATYP